MDRDDIDSSSAERLENTLELGLMHREIPIHHGLRIRSDEGGPSVDSHGIPHRGAVHMRHAPDGHLVNAVREGTLLVKDRLELRWVQRRLGRIELTARRLSL